ncbi:uncharacterized protein LOC142338111 [Convolutriloba macropyga]|uniref:uncharacterized protein LOC142338111 n=1 Tax=Convolutriloba macropyga TaxID=536237 RepID=UPI003F527A60
MMCLDWSVIAVLSMLTLEPTMVLGAATDVTAKVMTMLNTAMTGVKKPLEEIATDKAEAKAAFTSIAAATACTSSALTIAEDKNTKKFSYITYCAQQAGGKAAAIDALSQAAVNLWFKPGGYKYPGASEIINSCDGDTDLKPTSPFYIIVGVSTKNVQCQQSTIQSASKKRGATTFDYIACVFSPVAAAIAEDTLGSALFAEDKNFCKLKDTLDAELYGKIKLDMCTDDLTTKTCKSAAPSPSADDDDDDDDTNTGGKGLQAEVGGGGRRWRSEVEVGGRRSVADVGGGFRWRKSDEVIGGRWRLVKVGGGGRWRSVEVGGGRRRLVVEVGGGQWRRSVEVSGGVRGRRWEDGGGSRRRVEFDVRGRISCGVLVEVVVLQASGFAGGVSIPVFSFHFSSSFSSV